MPSSPSGATAPRTTASTRSFSRPACTGARRRCCAPSRAICARRTFPIRSTISGARCSATPSIAALLVERFRRALRARTCGSATAPKRTCDKEIEAALEEVQSLDDDTILRAFRDVIAAAVRTDFYAAAERRGARGDHAEASGRRRSPSCPTPRPYREIFVHSPQVEGLHLRFGPVARGGLALVRPAAGFPHRGARPGQGAAGEERRHRAGRRQGRLRADAASRGRPRGDLRGRAAGLHPASSTGCSR